MYILQVRVFEVITAELVQQAVKISDNYALDKDHTFKVCMYAELYSINATPDTFVETSPLALSLAPIFVIG